jgi:hypothetical protein
MLPKLRNAFVVRVVLQIKTLYMKTIYFNMSDSDINIPYSAGQIGAEGTPLVPGVSWSEDFLQFPANTGKLVGTSHQLLLNGYLRL